MRRFYILSAGGFLAPDVRVVDMMESGGRQSERFAAKMEERSLDAIDRERIAAALPRRDVVLRSHGHG
jgi:hypothetical protein